MPKQDHEAAAAGSLQTAIKAESLFHDSGLGIIGRLSVVPLTEDQWQWFLD
jgi:hypothetical protein